MKKFNTVLSGLRLTASEIAMGRVMRAPDHPTDAEFEAFVAAGEVEVGESNAQTAEDPKPGKPAGKQAASSPDAPEQDPEGGEGNPDDAGESEGGEEGGEGSEEGEETPEAERQKARENQINRLKRERREAQERARQLEIENAATAARLDALEKLLQPGTADDKSEAEDTGPDHTDADKYPLGHLDPAYTEDKLQWLAQKAAKEQADAALHRQQEIETRQQQEAAQAELLQKVDDLSTRGSEVFDDFQEKVVDAGLKGAWDLTQTTFEAAADAENGVQILYDLASNPAEATRVAKLSPFQQLKYVAEKDAEIAATKGGRKIPKASAPPSSVPKGANSKVTISPATDSLDDFEKLWEADARKGRR